MIALDTNVLVRFLVRDDKAQARKAKALVDRLGDGDSRGYVSDIVLCELVWVLTRSYRFERRRIVAALGRLAAARQLKFDSVDEIIRAVFAYERGKGDFADYLIREHARGAGCDSIATFDRDLLKDDMFSMP